MSVSEHPVGEVAGTPTAFGADVQRLAPARLVPDGLDGWLKHGLVRELPDLRLEALFEARPDLFWSLEHLVVAVDPSGRLPRAVLGSRWATTATGTRFLHISVMFVSQRLRGGDLFARTWLALLDEVIRAGGFPQVSVLKTYNPVAFCAMRAYGLLPGTAMYPDVGGAGQDGALRELALEIAETLAPGSDFDPDTGRIRGIGVPADLYRGRPESTDAQVNAYFARHAEPGDRILCIVHVRSAAVEQAILDGFRKRRAGPPDGRR